MKENVVKIKPNKKKEQLESGPEKRGGKG